MPTLKTMNRLPELMRDGDDDFEDLFRRLSSWARIPVSSAQARLWFPAVELTDVDDEFLLTAELPGVAMNDVQIDVQDNVLTLRGTKKQEQEKKEKRYHVWERSYGEFERSFSLPPNVDATAIRADFDAGVLKIHMPKRAEALSRRIPVSKQ